MSRDVSYSAARRPVVGELAITLGRFNVPYSRTQHVSNTEVDRNELILVLESRQEHVTDRQDLFCMVCRTGTFGWILAILTEALE